MVEFLVGALLALIGGYFYIITKGNEAKKEYGESKKSYEEKMQALRDRTSEWYGILGSVKKDAPQRPKNLTPKERIEEWLRRIK